MNPVGYPKPPPKIKLTKDKDNNSKKMQVSNTDIESLIAYANNLENTYKTIDKTWMTCNDENDKKKIVSNTLSWCKKMRDLFYDDSSVSIDTATDDEVRAIDNHETTWDARTQLWRSRFYESNPTLTK